MLELDNIDVSSTCDFLYRSIPIYITHIIILCHIWSTLIRIFSHVTIRIFSHVTEQEVGGGIWLIIGHYGLSYTSLRETTY